jgi:hypothetical protein
LAAAGSMRTRASLLAVLAGLIAGAAAPALHADWIVTRQGERFEIQGTWQQRGRLVVFTLPNGTLSSLHADRVDLEASRRATEEAKKRAEAPPAGSPGAPGSKGEGKAKRKAVIVLTDKDFRKPLPPAPPTEATSSPLPSAPGSPSTPPTASPLSTLSKDAKQVPASVAIESWDRVPAADSKADGVELTGVVRNTSQYYLTKVDVVANLFDDTGTLIAKISAMVDNQALPPTESSRFHLVASGVFAFATIRWDAQASGFKVAPSAAPPPASTSSAPPSPPPTPPN